MCSTMYLYSFVIRICVPCEHCTHNIGAVRMHILALILRFLYYAYMNGHRDTHTYAHVHASVHARARTHTHTHTHFFVLDLYVLE